MKPKTPTMKQVQAWIKEIEDDLKHNWSAWGDVGSRPRQRTINKLKKIRLTLNKPLRIDLFKNYK